MCKRLVIGVLRMSVITVLVAMWGTEAGAAICTTSKTLSTQTCTSWRTVGSARFCTRWCTGSEICDATIYGLGGNILKGCAPGESCPVVTCSAFGTVQLEEGPDCDPSTLDPDCGIRGKAVCEGSEPPAYTLRTVLTGFGDVDTCTKSGKCTKSLELDPDTPADNPCNEGDTFVSFVASKFNAQACFCPGGFDDNEVCCANADRSVTGEVSSCASVATVACIEQRCTVDLSNFKPGDNLPYTCRPIPDGDDDDE